MWTHEKLLSSLKTIWEDKGYRKLPRNALSELEGVRWSMNYMMRKHLVYAYFLDVRVKANEISARVKLTHVNSWCDIESESYRKIPPSQVCGHRGAYVWRLDTQKVFSESYRDCVESVEIRDGRSSERGIDR
jgi:hypothetical protein